MKKIRVEIEWEDDNFRVGTGNIEVGLEREYRCQDKFKVTELPQDKLKEQCECEKSASEPEGVNVYKAIAYICPRCYRPIKPKSKLPEGSR